MTPPDQMSQPPEGGWESLKVDELKDELEARGLPKSGKKAELVARLADDDVAQRENVPAAETPAEDEAPDEGGVAEEVVPPEEPAEEPSADEVEKAEAPARRRGSAETSAGTPPRAPRAAPTATLIVRARSQATCAARRARPGS